MKNLSTPAQYYRESAEYIKSRSEYMPSVAVILGEGLESFTDKLTGKTCILFEDIPHFKKVNERTPSSIVIGKCEDIPVIVLTDRFHVYDGFSISETAYPVGVLKLLGIKTLIISNSAGVLNDSYTPGDLVCVTDHIMITSDAIITCDEMTREKYLDMQDIYSPALVKTAHDCARWCGFSIKEGVYMYFPGPHYPTYAESKAMRQVGGDLVGSSTVPEAVAAEKYGLDVLCISCCTYLCPNLSKEPVNRAETLEVGRTVKRRFINLVSEVIKLL